MDIEIEILEEEIETKANAISSIGSLIRQLYAERGEDELTAKLCNEVIILVNQNA